MASLLAMRGLLAASLGLAVLDLAWINFALGPQALVPSAATPPGAPAVAHLDRPSAQQATPPPAPAPPIVAAPPASEPAPAVAIAQPVRAREPASPEPAEVTPASPPPAEPIATHADERIYFESMSARIDRAARAVLARVAKRAGARGHIVLEGRADERGDEQLNRNLSRDRAWVAAWHLRELGVPRARVRVRFSGERGAGAGGELWQDRRVDIQITGGDE